MDPEAAAATAAPTVARCAAAAARGNGLPSTVLSRELAGTCRRWPQRVQGSLAPFWLSGTLKTLLQTGQAKQIMRGLPERKAAGLLHRIYLLWERLVKDLRPALDGKEPLD